jgi:hypothetical protein
MNTDFRASLEEPAAAVGDRQIRVLVVVEILRFDP